MCRKIMCRKFFETSSYINLERNIKILNLYMSIFFIYIHILFSIKKLFHIPRIMILNITRLVIYLNYLLLTNIKTIQYMLYAKHRIINNNTIQLSTKHCIIYTTCQFNTYHSNTIQYNTVQCGTPNTP